MKTIEVGITQAQIAQEAFKDNRFFRGVKQVFTNVFNLPKFESETEELDYVDEIEMYLAECGVTEYNCH